MEWIKVADRLPTKEDADHTGYVLAWHETDGAFVQGYKRIYRSGFTHWAKIEPPKEYGMDTIDYIKIMKQLQKKISDKNNYRLCLKTKNEKTMIHVEMKYMITSMGEAWTSIYAIEKEFTALEYFIRALNRNDLYKD